MKIKDEGLFKSLYEIEWSDFQEKMGNYFLGLLNETNVEILEVLTTLIDDTATGDNRFCVYIDSNLRVRSELYFSLVNTFNYLKHGEIRTYIPPAING